MRWIRLFIMLFCLGIVLVAWWKYEPNVKEVKGKKEQFIVKKVQKGVEGYDVTLAYKKGKEWRYPTKEERKGYVFYKLHPQKGHFTKVEPTFMNMGTYRLKGKGEEVLLVRGKHGEFVGRAFGEEEPVFFLDNQMTKKTPMGRVSFLFNEIAAMKTSTCTYRFSQLKKGEVENVFVVSEDLRVFLEKKAELKGTDVTFKMKFPNEGNYLTFLSYKYKGKQQVISFGIHVNEEEME